QLRAADGGRDRSYEDTLVAKDDQGEDLARAQRDASLERGIRQLPPHQRIPIVLYHFEDRSYLQIADALGVSVGKVKTDIHRGRLALRKLIGESDDAR
ncbi:MAG: RNA polymerase sigma factor, partial [Bryobacterales bacterium]|nr:RNA polymerase sigma factor [Bryobacterales bacterium]